ncbi:chitotriosidase-1-like [Gigantopelta aegis]|uniref:chitotriosidase-1-like n=1 Tax=Gigantopelta aegis TaxID=1735272 RepID=UPI001B88C490|nr:chitotriosidase-1-like [Gigantopelta aegis]
MKLPFLALVCFIAGSRLVQGKLTFCYYSSDANYRPKPLGAFWPEDIDTNLCTHIIFAFADVDGYHMKPAIPEHLDRPWAKGLYSRTIALKKRNPNLKVLIAVGGWKVGSKPFAALIKTFWSRQQWVNNMVRYLRQYGFDGLDMDWEFPGIRGSDRSDKPKFTSYLRQIQDAFKEEARKTGKEKLILTLATAAGRGFIEAGYEPKEIVKHVDYLLVMTYNYHGQWEDNVGHHSGIYKNRIDKGWRQELNQEWTVNFWLDAGIHPSRFIMGIATYGMSYTLLSRWKHNIGDNATRGGRPGPYTTERGVLAYYEICQFQKNNNWKRVWIPEQFAPYSYGGDQWVGYDDVESIGHKARFLNEKNLGGAFVWSVEMDDFTGQGCGQGKYPLLKEINRIIGGPSAANSRPRPQKNEAPTSTGFQSPGVTGVSCSRLGPGLHRDPTKCRNFHLCVVWGNKLASYQLTCPVNTGFDAKRNSCMWMESCQWWN